MNNNDDEHRGHGCIHEKVTISLTRLQILQLIKALEFTSEVVGVITPQIGIECKLLVKEIAEQTSFDPEETVVQ